MTQRTANLIQAVMNGMKSSGIATDLIVPIVHEAEDGNPAAEFLVGSALEDSRPAEAIEWYRRAAEQGYRPAMAVLQRLEHPAA